MTVDDRRVLGAVFAVALKGSATQAAVARRLGVDDEYVRKAFKRLKDEGRLVASGRVLSLTEKGRRSIKVVFIGGGFEVIHPGHLHTIESARKLGDVLVVAVATDSTIRRRKKREPVSTQEVRARLLSSLRQVDAALVGSEGDIYETLEKVRPDVVALGYDQYHRERGVAKEAAKRGIRVKVVRLDSPEPGLKTSALLAEY